MENVENNSYYNKIVKLKVWDALKDEKIYFLQRGSIIMVQAFFSFSQYFSLKNKRGNRETMELYST